MGEAMVGRLIVVESEGRLTGLLTLDDIVDGRYDDLEEGVELNFLVEQGDEGPQATSVKVLA